MKRILILVSVLVPLVAASVGVGWFGEQQAKGPRMASGVVFHDANGNGKFDEGEKMLADVRVSNGRDIVKTDENGRYNLPVDDEGTILFVIQPSGWHAPLSADMLPQFFYVHMPKGSPKLKYKGVEPTGPLPESVDFALYPQEQPKVFKALLFGDPQPRNLTEVNYVANDVVAELVGTDASFGVTLGDIVHDDLTLFEPQNKAIAVLGIPWYNVLGNHDINMDARNRKDSTATFERVYGPSYYSFDYGSVHFLVVDDIDWHTSGKTKDEKTGQEKEKWTYKGGIGERQMEFIRNDLALIPRDQMVVLMMHIPLVNVHDRQELYRLIEQRPFCISISGHTHYHEHRFITEKDGWRGPEPHHHIINVTVSGSWWRGAPDERGIPHATMRDGAPNGYTIITFDGHKYTLDFKAAGRPADYQMHIHVADPVPVENVGETDVYVNVFNGSEKSTVEMRLGPKGKWIPMQQKKVHDPAYVKIRDLELAIKEKPWTAMSAPVNSSHLWHANLPAETPVGTHHLQVRTTDMFGRTFFGHRVIRVATVAKE